MQNFRSTNFQDVHLIKDDKHLQANYLSFQNDFEIKLYVFKVNAHLA